MATVVTQLIRCEINGVPSNTPGWDVTNIDELMKPADRRSAEAVVIVESHGRLARRMWRDGTTRILNWVIYGDRDREGTPFGDYTVGVQTNLQYLYTNIVDIPAGATSTRSLTLYLPDGTTRTGDVQVRDFDWSTDTGPTLYAVMELYLPSGQLL